MSSFIHPKVFIEDLLGPDTLLGPEDSREGTSLSSLRTGVLLRGNMIDREQMNMQQDVKEGHGL